MSIKRIPTLFLTVALCAAFLALPSNAAIIAGWDQNNNQVSAGPPAVFGFVPGSFPQANDHGTAAATHTIADFESTIGTNGTYANVQSFAGTTDNDLAGVGAGGSFSFVGNQSNGAKSVFSVPTIGYEDITVSWSQRGTATGYSSRVFEYSVDGGTSWVDIGAYAGSSGALGATFTTVSLDLSAITDLDNNPDAMFRITYDGATNNSGNNRWDNFYVQGTATIPEPTTLGLALASLGLLLARRK
jgi:hypothetical protein